MFVLPVSQVPVAFRSPDGRDELLLAEGATNLTYWRVEMVRRLAPPVDPLMNWGNLPYPDVDSALLGWRRALRGDQFVVEIQCSHCSAWGDVPLSVSQYLATKRPIRARRMQRLELSLAEDGWWTWKQLRFRIPTANAVVDACQMAENGGDVIRCLAAFCIDSASKAEPLVSRASCNPPSPEASSSGSSDTALPRASISAALNRLLEKIAPPLSGLIQGACPNCRAVVAGWFDPGAFVLSELQERVAGIFEDIHLLAHAYGWSENVILDLPSRRRALYASHIKQERRA